MVAVIIACCDRLCVKPHQFTVILEANRRNMAAKFSMVNTSGLFDSAAHVEASDRMQGAMEELKVKNERQEKARALHVEKQEKEDKQQERRLQEAFEAKAAEQKEDRSYVGQQQEEEELDSDDEAMLDELDEDPELERSLPMMHWVTLGLAYIFFFLVSCRIRAARLKQLKKEYEEKQTLMAKGHGEYREITQDEFLKEVTSSPLVAVHFYHRDFERCKIMDMHLAKLAHSHIECKFLKLNAEKAPFFVEKLMIRVLPTVVCFKDGVAFPERVIGFDGLIEDEEQAELADFGTRANHHATSSDTFPTAAVSAAAALDLSRRFQIRTSFAHSSCVMFAARPQVGGDRRCPRKGRKRRLKSSR
jgi:thiol-disulfide isomerase/thioredoxin